MENRSSPSGLSHGHPERDDSSGKLQRPQKGSKHAGTRRIGGTFPFKLEVDKKLVARQTKAIKRRTASGAEIDRQLHHFQERSNELKQRLSNARPVDYPKLRRVREALLDRLNSLAENDFKNMSDHQKKQIPKLRGSLKALNLSTREQGIPYIRVVSGGLPTLGKGHR